MAEEIFFLRIITHIRTTGDFRYKHIPQAGDSMLVANIGLYRERIYNHGIR